MLFLNFLRKRKIVKLLNEAQKLSKKCGYGLLAYEIGDIKYCFYLQEHRYDDRFLKRECKCSDKTDKTARTNQQGQYHSEIQTEKE